VASDCYVWHMHQARCLLCDWSGEVSGVAAEAASEVREHRASAEHQARLRERRKERTR